jgi:hypothetical protein
MNTKRKMKTALSILSIKPKKSNIITAYNEQGAHNDHQNPDREKHNDRALNHHQKYMRKKNRKRAEGS